MAYFLKKTTRKNGTYLQIYESYYNKGTKETSHKCFQSLGNINSLTNDEIPDPIAFYKDKVKQMNEDRKKEKEKETVMKIGDSPEKYLGYFLAKSIFYRLNLEKYIDILQGDRKFEYSIYELVTSLVYARLLCPCSKTKTFHTILPKLFDSFQYSESQMYDGIAFIGYNYEKIIEIINTRLSRFYKIVTDKVYFDCTNFYFEIDRCDSFRKKGPSKENRKDPIIGMGLLLDSNQIPIGMKMYPGNESEKPVIRDSVKIMKNRLGVEGRTIQVADKGLNCAKNIHIAMKNGDGYLFSKSVKQLPEKEKVWVLLENDYIDVLDSNGKVKYKYKSTIDLFTYSYTDENKKTHSFRVREKRIVTYNPTLAKKQIAEINKMVMKASGLCASQAKKAEYGESSKYVVFNSTNEGEVVDDKIALTMNIEKIEKDKDLAGYNLLVTSEKNMDDLEIYQTYHNLWKIEESFRIMKTDLDARPVFLQKEDSIKGHFLICYISVLILRLLQYQLFNNELSSSRIIKFMRDFRVIQEPGNRYINITQKSSETDYMTNKLDLPIDNYFLTKTQIKKVLSHRV
ncbi:IS1634 family transposase [Tannockella kyphosi]|uniref:IS1634 family transposase n=1 Tax=Tannockella kyphosi TaxID=2899121 RepID=UPI0020127BF4|nr:IS1634 family transposase [Tannockella kyphosi]